MAIGGTEFKIDFDDGIPYLRIDLTVSIPGAKRKDKHLPVRALIDTGSDNTFIPSDIINELGLMFDGRKPVEYKNSQTIKIDFYVAQINIKGILEGIFKIGSDDSTEPIIGMDILSKMHLLMNCPNGTFEIASPDNYIQPG